MLKPGEKFIVINCLNSHSECRFFRQVVTIKRLEERAWRSSDGYLYSIEEGTECFRESELMRVRQDESPAVAFHLISEDDRKQLNALDTLFRDLSLAVHAAERELAELRDRLEGKE